MPARTPRLLPALAACSVMLLAGCDQLGIETPDKLSAKKEAEAKAIGAACRNAGRAIEDCYTLNPKAGKAAVFAGWREMDEYMRENKLDAVPATLPHPGAARREEAAEADEAAAAHADDGDKGDKGDKAGPARKGGAEAPSDESEASAKAAAHTEKNDKRPSPAAEKAGKADRPEPADRSTKPAKVGRRPADEAPAHAGARPAPLAVEPHTHASAALLESDGEIEASAPSSGEVPKRKRRWLDMPN